MKKKLIFIFIILVVFVVSLYFFIKTIVDNQFNNVINTNEYLTFYNIEYDKISINFSKIKISNLNVSQGENLLIIPKLELDFNLFQLTTFNIDKVINELVISQPVLNIKDYDLFENSILEKLNIVNNNRAKNPDKVNLFYNIPIKIEQGFAYLHTENQSRVGLANNVNVVVLHNAVEYNIDLCRINFIDDILNIFKNRNIAISEELEKVLLNLQLATIDNIKGTYNNGYIEIDGYFNGGNIVLDGKISESLIIKLERVPFFYDYVRVYLNSNLIYNIKDKYIQGTANLEKINVGLMPVPDLDFNIDYDVIEERYNINLITQYGTHEIKIDFVDNIPIFYFEAEDLDLKVISDKFDGLLDYNIYLNVFSEEKELLISVSADSFYYSDIPITGSLELLFGRNQISLTSENFYINNYPFIINSNGQFKSEKYYFNKFLINDNLKFNDFYISYKDKKIILENLYHEKVEDLLLNTMIFDYEESSFDINATAFDNYDFNILLNIKNKNNLLLSFRTESKYDIFNDTYLYDIKINEESFNLQSNKSPFDLFAVYERIDKNFHLNFKPNKEFNKELTKHYGKSAFTNINIEMKYSKDDFYLNGGFFINNIDNIDILRINFKTDTETNIISFKDGIFKTSQNLFYYNGIYDLTKNNLKLDFNINQIELKTINLTGNISFDVNIFKEKIEGIVSSRHYRIGNYDIRNAKFGFDYNYENRILNIHEYIENLFTLKGNIIFDEIIHTDISIINEKQIVGSLKGNIDYSNNHINMNIFNDKNNLTLLPLYFPVIKNIKGKGLIDIKLEGEINSPSYIGEIQLENVYVDLDFYLRELKNLNGKIIFERDNIILDNITATNDRRGRIHLNGTGTDIKNMKLDINAKNIRIEIPVFEANFLSDLSGSIITTDTEYYINANVDLFNGVLTYPPPKESETKEQPKKEKTYWGNPIIDARLNTKSNFRFINNFANVVLEERSNLRIKRYDDEIELTGTLRAAIGTINYLNRNLRINNAELKFTEADNIPILDIEASTVISEINVILTLTGPVTDLNPVMISNSHPDLTNEELLRLLRFGQIDQISLEHQQEQVISDIISYIEADYMNQLIRPLRTNLEKRLGINLEIGAPIISNIARRTITSDRTVDASDINLFENTYFSVGKFLSDRFYVNYRGALKSSHDISVERSPLYLRSEIEARYFFHPRLTLQYIFKPELHYVDESNEHFFMFQYRMRY